VIPFKLFLTNLDKYRFQNSENDYFFYFIRGKTVIKINREIHTFTSNNFFLSQVLDEITIIEAHDTLCYVLEISEVSLTPYLNIVDSLDIFSSKLGSSSQKMIHSRFFQLVNHYFNSSSYHLLIQSSLLLFLDGLGKQSTLVETDAMSQSNDSQRIQLIKRTIYQNLHTRLSIEDLAKQLYLTPQYLSKYIKDKMGISYLKYVNQLRVKLAEKDLDETNYSLTYIANQRGFANVNALINAFKEIHQMTPREYRLTYRNEHIQKEQAFSTISINDKELASEHIREHLKEIEQESTFTHIINKSHIIDATKGFLSEHSTAQTVNLGFARNILSNAFQDQLAKLQGQLNFTYARFQGIFEHGIVDRIPHTEIYNFSKANRIIDFLYENQLLPFIEMGNKPEKINLSAEQYVSLSENNKLYRNNHEWQLLVKSFIKNCINRYGTSEVSKWIFDYWYPHGKALEYSLSYADNYMNNYQILYDTIKHYLPVARVGGMSLNITADETDISAIVNYTRLRKIPFDFISITAFHTEGYHHMPSLTTNPNYLTDKMIRLKKLTHIESIPLILAEWSFDVSTRNYLHDSLFMSSFIIKNLLENSDGFTDISYWLMSDLMIEFTDTNKLLFGGNGLLSVDGLPKPSYFAYQFYRRLGKRIIDKGDGYVITSNSIDSYQILLYNYQHPKETYCTQYQSDLNYHQIDEIFNEPEYQDISISLKNLVKGHYKIKTYLISEEHGSILNEWIKLGGIKNLSSNEISYLRNITQPSMHVKYSKETEEILINEVLKPFEVKLIQISLEYQEH